MDPPADGRNTSYPFANLVPQDGSGKAFERTPDQVLPPARMLCYAGDANSDSAMHGWMCCSLSIHCLCRPHSESARHPPTCPIYVG